MAPPGGRKGRVGYTAHPFAARGYETPNRRPPLSHLPRAAYSATRQDASLFADVVAARAGAAGVRARQVIRGAFAPQVTRDTHGTVIGPAYQYVLAGVEHNRKPFTAGTGLKIATFLTAAYMVLKGGVLNSPADLISAADSVGDSIVHLASSTLAGAPELRSDYFAGFWKSAYKCNTTNPADLPGETCYAPGGTYYQRAAADPAHGRLWGYLVDGPNSPAADALVPLLMSGAFVAFAYANRKTLRQFMSQLARLGPTEGGAEARAKFLALGIPLGIAGAKTAALLGLALAATIGMDRETARAAATALMIGAGVATITKEYRHPIQIIPGAKPIAWPLALPLGLAWCGLEAGYRWMADSAGLYQFMPDGDPTIYGNWPDWRWRFNLDLFATEVATNLVIFAPIWARAAGFAQNAVDVAYAGLSRRVHRGATSGIGRRALRRVVKALPEGEDVQGHALPDYLGVRRQVQGFTPDERAAIPRGTAPSGKLATGFGNLLILGGTAYLGYEGVDSILALANGTSRHTVFDGMVSLAALGATVTVADSLLRDGKGRFHVRRLTSLLAHLFGANGRAPYWVIYTLVGGLVTVSISMTSQAMQGFELQKEGYGAKLALRALANPWVNRITFGVRSAYHPDRMITKFGFFFPGFATLFGAIEYNAQTGQSVDLYYQAVARNFAVATDPEARQGYLADMAFMEGIVREAVRQKGYGRAQTFRRAEQTLQAMNSYKDQYGVPPYEIAFVGSEAALQAGYG